MATYFMFGKYSLEGMKGISAGRTDKTLALIKKHGGELKAGYALLGDVDLVLIVDMPDTGQAMKTSAALAKLLGASFSTAPAVSVAEFDKLMSQKRPEVNLTLARFRRGISYFNFIGHFRVKNDHLYSSCTPEDQQAKINPRNVHSQNFLVAEDNGQVVGVRQVKVHSQGTREKASGFVLPEYRHQGISAHLMNELLAREAGPLYTMVNEKWVPYYEQFGFRRMNVEQLPSDFRKEY